MKEDKRKANALRVLTLFESISMLNLEDLKDVLKVYDYDVLERYISQAFSNIEDIEEEGLLNLYYETLEEERESDKKWKHTTS